MDRKVSEIKINLRLIKIKQLILKISHYFIEGGWVFLGQAISLFGVLLLTKILTSNLIPSEYGKLSLGLTIVGLVNQLAFGGIANGAGRFFSIAIEKKEFEFYSNGLIRIVLFLILGIFTFGITLIFFINLMDKRDWHGLILASLIFSLISGLNSILTSIQNAARQRAVVAVHLSGESWLRILVTFFFLFFIGLNSTNIVMAYGISALIIMFSQWYLFKHTWIVKINWLNITQSSLWTVRIWKYSWPFMLWGIFGWAQQSASRWALEYYATSDDVGYYAVLIQIGYLPIALVISLTQSLLNPIIFEKMGDGSNLMMTKLASRMILWISVIAILMTFLSTLIAYRFNIELISLFASSQYLSGAHLLPLVVFAGGIFGVAQLIAVNFFAKMATKEHIIPSILSSVFGISASILGAIHIGLEGTIWALLIHSVAYLVLLLIFNQRIIKNR